MRTKLGFWVAIVAIALSLLTGEARAKDDKASTGPAVLGYVGPHNAAPITVDDLSTGVAERAWLNGQLSVLADDARNGHLRIDAALRKEGWSDGLSRKALPIVRVVNPKSKTVSLIVKLPKAPSPKYGKWNLRALPQYVNVVPIKFQIGTEIFDQLPEQFCRRPVGAVEDLIPRAEGEKPMLKEGWLSAGDLVEDDPAIRSALKAPIFAEEFSDFWGPSGLVRFAPKEKSLLLCTTVMTRRLDPRVKQPESEEAFDRAQYVVIGLFVDKDEKPTPYWPWRLKAYRLHDSFGKQATEPGAVLYASPRWLYLWLPWGDPEKRWFNTAPGAVYQLSPFSDEFGPAYEVSRTDKGADFVVTKTADSPYQFHVYADGSPAGEYETYSYR